MRRSEREAPSAKLRSLQAPTGCALIDQPHDRDCRWRRSGRGIKSEGTASSVACFMSSTFADNPIADIPLRVDEQGVIRIGHTGVQLESVLARHRDGASLSELLASFPSLDAADLHLVLGYALRHPTEMDDYLKDRAEDEARIRQDIESQFDASHLKERIQQQRRSPE